MKLLIATRNPGKLKEIRTALNLNQDMVKSSLDYPNIPEVIEDKETLEGNAIKKATEMSLATGCWALSDDSGLEVDALDGAPGVYSARYAGENCSYEDNNKKLIDTLNGIKNRTAKFRTVLALVNLVGDVRIVEGCCSGVIIDKPRGIKGFGYDPIFIPNGYSMTYAEMNIKEKNNISHRGKALNKALEKWGFVLSQFNNIN
tara:strand:+ start:360 stop:965 length:606 start_codon:yes stop_codon:yes gene_type:complete